MSGACRASHTEELYDLPSARLLRELDDDDMAIVRQTRHKKVSVYWGFFLGVPALIASLTSDIVSDLIQKFIPPLLVGGFLLLNAVLADISIYAVTMPYLLLFVIYVYVYFIYHSARNRINMSRATGIPYANNIWYIVDRVVVFLSYDGIKQCLYRANTNSNVTTSNGFMNKMAIDGQDQSKNSNDPSAVDLMLQSSTNTRSYGSEHNQSKSSLANYNNHDITQINQQTQVHTTSIIRQTNTSLNDHNNQEKNRYSSYSQLQTLQERIRNTFSHND